jgi:hypothetical protein
LGLQATDLEKIDFTFNLIQRDNGETIRLHLKIQNIDDIAHNIGMGLLYDPALGLWGDGFAFVNGQLIQADTSLQSIPGSFELWERKDGPKGMGVQFKYVDNLPSELMFGNWFNFHYELNDSIDPIYDLAIEMGWAGTMVDPGESISYTIDISLESPEFPDGVFMRSDMPYFLSIENNLLFPREVKSLVKLGNNGSSSILGANLEFLGDGFIEDWNSPDTIDIPSGSTVYTSASLDIPETYKEMLITLELNLVDGSDTLDQITRTLFIPAAPFSDSGLVVTIDTIILSNFPFVDIIFKAQVEETGQYLKELGTENVFFYEDQQQIEDFTLDKDTTGGVNQADIIFVLDVTGSMTDEIQGVKDNIVEFADSLSYQGIDFQLGMVTFLDVIENVYDFTSDVQLFQQYVNAQYAHGGGDHPENSLDALMEACQFDFRLSANRIFIWITDATYHINNSNTQLEPQDVVNEMLMHSVVPHGIGQTYYQLDWFNPILFPTAGDFYDINGNFRDILLQISRLNSTGYYRLSYLSNASPGDTVDDIVEVHYAGLGGLDTISFIAPSKSHLSNDLAIPKCFPNPFYSSAYIEIENTQELEARLEIYNAQGQRVTSKYFERGNKVLRYTWDAKDDGGKTISSGLYFVHFELYDPPGKAVSSPVMKLIYLK